MKKNLSLKESKENIRKRIEEREDQFLKILEKAVFNYSKSPYLSLISRAGYKFEDIGDLVKCNGIENTLHRLAGDGIYITFEEFKGRKKVKRDRDVFHFSEADFDNPFLSSCFGVESGGTLSAGTRTMIDFDFLTCEAAHRAVALDLYGLLDSPCILWFPVLPGNAGIMNLLRQARINNPPIKWFSQVDKNSIKPSVADRFGTTLIVYMGRFLGRNLPRPEYVDLNDANKIAEYIASVLNKHSQCSLWTYVNSAVRICAAAKNGGIDLKGAFFFVVGERVTSTKLNEIKYSGASVIPYYAFAESGIVGYGCLNPYDPDHVHILRDQVASISRKKFTKHSGDTVDALLFTSLLPEAPKILLNVENGDYGLIRSFSCGCGFEAYGYTDHLSQIGSFEKFTSEGMTFMVSELIHIAEDVLPTKFGGSSSDYQVLEEYGKDGITSICFIVSPRTGPFNESELISTVIGELKKGEGSKRLMAEIWSKANTIRVKRADPVPTRRGKILPFRSENMF